MSKPRLPKIEGRLISRNDLGICKDCVFLEYIPLWYVGKPEWTWNCIITTHHDPNTEFDPLRVYEKTYHLISCKYFVHRGNRKDFSDEEIVKIAKEKLGIELDLL